VTLKNAYAQSSAGRARGAKITSNLDFSQPLEDWEVTCARCGKIGMASEYMVEEGDEWECPPCWERCEAAAHK
jgi:hypothetical protein